MSSALELPETLSLEEQEQNLRAELRAEYTAYRSSIVGDVLGGIREELREAAKPDRTQLERIHKDVPVTDPQVRGNVTVTPAENARYRLMSDEDRKWRNPHKDHYIAQWIRGLAKNNLAGHHMMQEAEDQLSRADTLEGTITAVTLTGSGSGGPLLPVPFSNLIVRARDKAAKLRSRVTIYNSESLMLRVPVPAVATAAMAGEGAVAAQGEPALTTKLFTKKKMQANFEASEEMLEDSALNLVSFFAERAGSAFGALEDVQIMTSSGTAPNITESFKSATLTAITLDVANTLDYQEVLEIYFAVPQQYRTGAAWFTDSTVLSVISQIVDGNGRPLFVPNTGPALPTSDDEGAVGSLFGHPVIDVPATAGELRFGNLMHYGVLDGGGIRAKTSDSALWAADSVAFRFTTRFDGNVMLENAFREALAITTAG